MSGSVSDRILIAAVVIAAALCVLVYIAVRGKRTLRVLLKCRFGEIALRVGGTAARRDEHPNGRSSDEAGIHKQPRANGQRKRKQAKRLRPPRVRRP